MQLAHARMSIGTQFGAAGRRSRMWQHAVRIVGLRSTERSLHTATGTPSAMVCRVFRVTFSDVSCFPSHVGGKRSR